MLLVLQITDEGMTHSSNMVLSNSTFKTLNFINCNITDNGVRYICERQAKNQALVSLDIRDNPQIT